MSFSKLVARCRYIQTAAKLILLRILVLEPADPTRDTGVRAEGSATPRNLVHFT